MEAFLTSDGSAASSSRSLAVAAGEGIFFGAGGVALPVAELPPVGDGAAGDTVARFPPVGDGAIGGAVAELPSVGDGAAGGAVAVVSSAWTGDIDDAVTGLTSIAASSSEMPASREVRVVVTVESPICSERPPAGGQALDRRVVGVRFV
jgi:hypothetical protein